jgi:hypothetical protein
MNQTKSKEQIEIEKLQRQLSTTERIIKTLESKINFLERENNRRKSDINQIADAVKRL